MATRRGNGQILRGRSFNDSDNDEGNVSRLAKAKAGVKGWLSSGVSSQSSPRTHTDRSKSIRTTVDVPARYTSVYLDTLLAARKSIGIFDFVD